MGKKNKNKSAAPAAAAAPAAKPTATAPKKQEAKPAAAAPKKQEPKKQTPTAAAAPQPKQKPAAKPAAASAPPAKKAKVEPKKPEPEPKAVSASEGEDDEDAGSDDEDEDEEGIELDVEALNAMIEIGGQLEELKDAEETESVEATLKVVAKYIPKRMALYEERKKAIAKLDKFWGFVISENEDLESMIDNENDLVLLSALEDITVKYNEQNPATYQIKFTFAPNDFLSGNTITVNVTASNEQEATVKVTPIQWKKGKNFTAASTNEPANKKKRAAEYDGFFHFFVNSQEAGADDFFNVIAHEVYPNALELFLKARGLFPGGDSDSDEDGEGFQFDEMDSDDEDMEEDDE